MNDVRLKSIELLSESSLFSGISNEVILQIVAEGTEKAYKRGDIIRDSENTVGGLGVVISGKIIVRKGSSVINNLSTGSIIGIADLFRKTKIPPSNLIASTETTIYIIPRETVINFLQSNSTFLDNYLTVLTSKIDFLTDRIKSISGPSATQKLESFIKDSPNGSADCSNMSLMAKKLDMSRASLYRAIASLEQQNIIRKVENKLQINEKHTGD